MEAKFWPFVDTLVSMEGFDGVWKYFQGGLRRKWPIRPPINQGEVQSLLSALEAPDTQEEIIRGIRTKASDSVHTIARRRKGQNKKILVTKVLVRIWFWQAWFFSVTFRTLIHTTPVKVPRPLVALALAKNLDSVWPWCDYQNNNNLALIFLPHIYGVMYWKFLEDKFHPLLKTLLTIFIIQDK